MTKQFYFLIDIYSKKKQLSNMHKEACKKYYYSIVCKNKLLEIT